MSLISCQIKVVVLKPPPPLLLPLLIYVYSSNTLAMNFSQTINFIRHFSFVWSMPSLLLKSLLGVRRVCIHMCCVKQLSISWYIIKWICATNCNRLEKRPHIDICEFCTHTHIQMHGNKSSGKPHHLK